MSGRTRKLAHRATEITRFTLDRSRDIELFGMYGAENLGDEAMQIAGLRLLPRQRTQPTIRRSRSHLIQRVLTSRTFRHVVIGGGTIIHGGTTNWLEHVEEQTRRGAKVYVIGTGLAFTESEIQAKSRAFLRWQRILLHSEVVAVRGPLSVRICDEMGVEATVFGDPCFSLLDGGRDTPGAGEGVIGVNAGNCLQDQPEFEDQMVAYLQGLPCDWRVKFFLVTPSDAAATGRVIDRAGLGRRQVGVVSCYSSLDFFRAHLRGCDLFVGLKLHSSGLALVSGVPAIFIEYQPKCVDFVAAIGAENSLVKIDLALSRNLVQKTAEIMEDPTGFLPYTRMEAFRKTQIEFVRRLTF